MPILAEYEKKIRYHYNDNRDFYLLKIDSIEALNKSLETFEKTYGTSHLIVSEAYDKLHKFSVQLPDSSVDLKAYIQGITKKLGNSALPILDRALMATSLPNDSMFRQKLSATDTGTGLINQMIQFVQIITSSIIEALTSKLSIVSIYRQKVMDQLIENIISTPLSEEQSESEEESNSMVMN